MSSFTQTAPWLEAASRQYLADLAPRPTHYLRERVRYRCD